MEKLSALWSRNRRSRLAYGIRPHGNHDRQKERPSLDEQGRVRVKQCRSWTALDTSGLSEEFWTSQDCRRPVGHQDRHQTATDCLCAFVPRWTVDHGAAGTRRFARLGVPARLREERWTIVPIQMPVLQVGKQL